MRRMFIFTLTALSLLFFSCDKDSDDKDSDDEGDRDEGGSVTIELTGDGTNENKELLVALYGGADDPETDTPVASVVITVPSDGTTANALLTEHLTNDTWYAVSDTVYDIYLFIDVDGDEDRSAGDLSSDEYWPKVYNSINSDTTLIVDEADLKTDLSSL